MVKSGSKEKEVKKTGETTYEDLLDHLKKERSRFTVNMSSGTGGQNARYGFFPKKFNQELIPYQKENEVTWACHSRLGSCKSPNQVKSVWSLWVPAHEEMLSKEICDQYFSWITGEKSPWRSLLSMQTPLVVNGENLNSPEFMKNIGFVFHELDKVPSNFVVNFLIATRMCHEWPKYIRDWATLVNTHGLDERIAFLFTSMFILDAEDKKYRLATGDKYDWPVDIMTCSRDYFENFYSGTPGRFHGNFSKSSCYTPVNSIWGVGSKAKKDLYNVQLYEKYKSDSNIGGVVPNENDNDRSWGTFYQTDKKWEWRVTYEEMIDIFKKEQEEIIMSCKSELG